MARMRKPFFSNCSMMSPTAFLRTASGLTMVKVRCRVFMLSDCPLTYVSRSWDSLNNYGSHQSLLQCDLCSASTSRTSKTLDHPGILQKEFHRHDAKSRQRRWYSE